VASSSGEFSSCLERSLVQLLYSSFASYTHLRYLSLVPLPELTMLTSVLTLSLAALASAMPVALSPRATCYSGVYVIGARGSEEAAGFGSTASVVNGVLADIPGSGSVALDYPASVLDPVYPDSVTDGINALITLVNNYVSSCPGGKIVLVGFSQGGNVITDALAGGVDKPTPLPASTVASSEFLPFIKYSEGG
jgi:acetylxylan esterase